MRILILDDDEELSATLAHVAELEGIEAITVSSLQEAHVRISESDFATAVLDLNLEDGNSLSLLRDLKLRWEKMHVVVMSGGGRIGPDIGLPLATANGADRVLFKPFSNQEFLEALYSFG